MTVVVAYGIILMGIGETYVLYLLAKLALEFWRRKHE